MLLPDIARRRERVAVVLEMIECWFGNVESG